MDQRSWRRQREVKALVRMDGTNIGSITTAINKAYTSIAFR